MAKINEMVLSSLQVALITEKITDGEFTGLAKSLDAKKDQSLVICDPACVSAYEMQNKKNIFTVIESVAKQLSDTELKIWATTQQLTEQFVEKAAKAGVGAFRVMDNENNLQNLAKAVALVVKSGKTCEGAICYLNKNTEDYTDIAEKLKGLGCKSFCLVDNGSCLTPKKAIELVKATKEKNGLPCGVSVTDNSHLAGAVYYALASLADFFDSSMLESTEGIYFSSKVMTTIIAESDSKDKPDQKAFDSAEKQLQEILGKNISGLSTAMKPARAYDIAIEGQKYHVEVHPSKIGAVIKPVAVQAAKPASARPQVTRPSPSGAAASVARPAPSSAASGSSRPVATPKPVAKAAPKPEPQTAGSNGTKEVKSSMQGTIVKVLVKEGDAVERGQRIAVLEAMKMENDILATYGGTIEKISIAAGDAVQTGQTLITIN